MGRKGQSQDGTQRTEHARHEEKRKRKRKEGAADVSDGGEKVSVPLWGNASKWRANYMRRSISLCATPPKAVAPVTITKPPKAVAAVTTITKEKKPDKSNTTKRSSNSNSNITKSSNNYNNNNSTESSSSNYCNNNNGTNSSSNSIFGISQTIIDEKHGATVFPIFLLQKSRYT